MTNEFTTILPPRFINYRVEWDTHKSKWNKIPCNADGVNINHLDPSQWMDHTTAASRAHWDTSRTGAYGVAFVLNGDQWACIDLDNCRDGDKWTADANLTFLSFGGALGEVSMSGTGLHVFLKCDPEQLKDRRNKWEGDKEFYMDGRFIALSQAGPQPIGTGGYTDQDWTQQLLKFVPQREFLGDLPDGRDPAYTGPENDDELIELMLRSSGGAGAAFGMKATVGELWVADPVTLGKYYPPYHDGQPYDASSADAALMSHLAFWTGKDMPRMDRLFRMSGLMREKYELRDDYRRSTVEKAARLCQRVYDRPVVGKTLPGLEAAAGTDVTAGAASHSNMLRISQQQEYFKGCTYVADVHKVLMPTGDLYTPERFNAVMGGYSFQTALEGGRPTKKAFEALTENQLHQFPKARTTMFRPEMEPGLLLPDGSVNVWVPPTILRRQGDIGPFLDFMHKMFPHGDDMLIMLDWMRDVVQNPGWKAMWAPVVQGTEGNGKSLIGAVLSHAIGQNYVHKPKATRLGEKFDSWVLYKLLIWVDEFYSKDRFNLLEGLKPMITDYLISIRGMQAAEALAHAPINWYFATNHRDAVRKNSQDRRYCPFITPHQTAEERDADFTPGEYFPKLWSWLRGGGFEFIAEWLWTSEAERFGPYSQQQTVAPTTTTTHQVMDLTRDPIQSEIIEAVEGGIQGFQGGWISSWALNHLLEQKHYRIPPTRRKQILEEMGYVQHGRAGRAIFKEGTSRPILWCVPSNTGMSLEQYEQAQGY